MLLDAYNVKTKTTPSFASNASTRVIIKAIRIVKYKCMEGAVTVGMTKSGKLKVPALTTDRRLLKYPSMLLRLSFSSSKCSIFSSFLLLFNSFPLSLGTNSTLVKS